jgi:hypothetical protein
MCDYPHIATYRYPKEVVYMGWVVPRQSWLSENEFFLTTGDMDAPVRILDKRNIIQAWVDRSNVSDNVKIVDSKYVVTAGPLNRYSCTCTAYKYRNHCSHIDGVKNASL